MSRFRSPLLLTFPCLLQSWAQAFVRTSYYGTSVRRHSPASMPLYRVNNDLRRYHSSTTSGDTGETVASVLEWASKLFEANGVPDATISAEYLVLHSLGLPPTRSLLSKHASNPISSEIQSRVKALCQRRVAREPLQYLIGNWDFHRITLDVRPPILIPRPETEELVEMVLECEGLKQRADLKILDIGVGSGAIGLALLNMLPKASCVGIDINPKAVELARANAQSLNLASRYECLQVGIEQYDGQGGPFDIVVSNPPYIPREQMETLQEEVRRYEDWGALDGGVDGGDIIRSIIAKSPSLLKKDSLGRLWMEVDTSHPEVMEAWLREQGGSGMKMREWRNDFCGRPRFVCLELKR